MSVGKILVIDDDQTTRDSLQMLLEFEGFTVDVCHDGPSALELVKKDPFEVFLVDYRMPGMNGVQLVRRLRRRCPSAVIIGFSVEFKEKVFLEAGADFFLGKDVIVKDLIATIRRNRV